MADQHPPHPHAEEPPRPPDRAIPPFPLLWRGAALGVLALALARFGLGTGARHWALIPVSFVFLFGALLVAWGSAIQLLGGARHDDHPWV